MSTALSRVCAKYATCTKPLLMTPQLLSNRSQNVGGRHEAIYLVDGTVDVS